MSANEIIGLSAQEAQQLLGLARDAIACGVHQGQPLRVEVRAYPAPLQHARATFVTLHLEGQLRGCIGSLYALRPLVEDVAYNAYAAAFSDPRFPPVRAVEHASIDISISVLSAPKPLRFTSETELLAQLRPGEDGLILEEGRKRSTFLPAVWSSLPDPALFLAQLKRKAGLPADYWSESLNVYRYSAINIGADKH